MSFSLSRDCGNNPCVKISGNKCDRIIFNEECRKILDYQGIFRKYLSSNEAVNKIHTDEFSIYLKAFNFLRVLRECASCRVSKVEWKHFYTHFTNFTS